MRISVTEYDIANGIARDMNRNPVARAIARLLPVTLHPCVLHGEVRIGQGDRDIAVSRLPEHVVHFLQLFNRTGDRRLKSFEFDLPIDHLA